MRGLSQKKLAEIMHGGYSDKTVSVYEQAGRPLSPEFLESAAKALKCSKDELIGDELDTPREFGQKAQDLFDLEGLPNDLLWEIFGRLTKEIPEAEVDSKIKKLRSLRAITVVLERRALDSKTPSVSSGKGKSSSSENAASRAIEFFQTAKQAVEEQGQPAPENPPTDGGQQGSKSSAPGAPSSKKHS